MDNEEKKTEEKAVLTGFTFIIPQCCREGWDSCKHVAKKERRKKRNVGL